MTIRLRFVSYSDLTGRLITEAEHGSPWDHVEAVMPDGSGYLGAVSPDGVKVRPGGYDKATMARELFVDLPAENAMTSAFYAGLQKHIGEPYDFAAILGFVTGDDLHTKQHAICSALQVLELTRSKLFPFPLVRPPHEIDPADLLLVLSGIVEIKDAP